MITVNMSLGRPCAKLKNNISKDILKLGSCNNLVQLAECQIFSPKITPPYHPPPPDQEWSFHSFDANLGISLKPLSVYFTRY